MTERRLQIGTAVACVLGILPSTHLSAECLFPTRLSATVGINVSTTNSRASAPGEATLTDDSGSTCFLYTVSATIKVIQDSPSLQYVESGSAPGSYVHTLDAPAQIDSCYSSSISASGGNFENSSAAGPQCWYGPPPPPPGDGDDDGGESGGSGGGCIDPSSCSPLLLDLNGDGIHTTGADAPVWFDLDGDGKDERIGWSNPATSEAFLWIDLTPNHVVDNGRELFGVGTILPNGQRARDGFEALTVHDQPENGGNGDGKVTVADAIWGRLRLWVDGNHDGVSQATEIAPLQSAQVLELRLNAIASTTYDAQGNLHGLQSTYAAHAHQRGERLLEDIFFKRFE